MKRLWFCLLTIAVLFSACGKGAPPPEESGEDASAPEQALPPLSEYELPQKILFFDAAYTVRFEPDENGLCMTVTGKSGGSLTAVCTENGSYKMRQSSLEYGSGREETWTEFDETGAVRQVTENSGNISRRMDYENGLLKREVTTYATGSTRTEEYVYDQKGRLTANYTRRNDGSPESESVYEYDGDNLVKVTSRTDGRDEPDTITYEYDAQGRTTKRIDHSAYSGADRIYSWEYNEHGDVISETIPYSEDWILGIGPDDGAWLTYSYEYEYDESGRKVREICRINEELQYESSFSYPAGRIQTVTRYPDGRIHETAFDEANDENRLRCVYRYEDGTESVRYDILETAPVRMTDVQYAYFFTVLLHMSADPSVSLRINC